MTKHLKNLTRGFSMVIDIAPKSRSARLIPKGPDSVRLNGDLRKVGRDMGKVFREAVAHDKPQRKCS